MKTCSKCKLEKELNYFHKASRNKDGRTSYCKTCMMEYARSNQESIKKSKDAYHKRKKIETQEERAIKKEKRALKLKAQKIITKRNRSERQKLRYKNNPEPKRLCDKNYREKNKLERNRKDRERKSIDVQYRLTINLRIRMLRAIENNQKTGSAVSDLGCTIDFLKSHLESLFQPGMSWDNYGKGYGCWQIDHIKALCLFDLTDREQFLKACHYTNLQPLWYSDHLNKTVEDISKKRIA